MSAIEVRKQKEASNAPIIPFPQRWRNSQAFAQGVLSSRDLIFTGSFFLCNLSSLSPPAASSTRRRKQMVVIAGQARIWAKPSHSGEEREKTKDGAVPRPHGKLPSSSPMDAFPPCLSLLTWPSFSGFFPRCPLHLSQVGRPTSS